MTAIQMGLFDGDDRVLGELNRELRRKRQKPRVVDAIANPVASACSKCFAHISRGDEIYKIATHRSAKGVWVCGLCASHHKEKEKEDETAEDQGA